MASYTKYNLAAITDRRKELKLSQRKLAARCGLSATTIQGYEQGRFSPKLENILKICEALELPLSSVVQVEGLQTFESPLEFELAPPTPLRHWSCRSTSSQRNTHRLHRQMGGAQNEWARAFAILIKRTEPNELKELIKEAVREVLNE